ncbi:MAG: AAA family ATPase [Hyphomonadaceae bacterium]|nr:AAA family ATPase [Hyphomonadaceae bacterium]
MTAKVVSVANMKGGVGKTTVAVALAHELAKGVGAKPGERVLLIDLDAQANASFWLSGDEALSELIERGKTVDGFLEDTIIFGKTPQLKDYVHQTTILSGADMKIFVIPSSPGLRIVEREMISFLSRRTRSLLEVERVVSELLVDQLEKLKADFDVIIFDSAPGISALTEAALRASDLVVVPTVPDFISNLGLEAFCKSVWWSNKDSPEERTPFVLANMVKTTEHHKSMLAEMREEAGAEDGAFKMFALEIPDMPWIEEATASVNGAGARAFAADASGLFAKLAAEVVEAMNAPAPPRRPRPEPLHRPEPGISPIVEATNGSAH